MSVKQMALVWEHEFSKSEQSIMLALTDHAHDDGTQIFPSKARIAWKTDYSEMHIYRVIKDLTKKGVLILVKKSSQHRPNEYKINWKKAIPKEPFRDNTMSTLENPEITSDDPGVTFETSRDNIAMLPKPSLLNHHIEPSEILSAWEKYFPKKTQPKPATYKSKINARMKNTAFRDNWEPALKRAANSPHLQSQGWFQLRWFVHNDENFQKILDGVFDSFDKDLRQNGRQISDPAEYQADLEARRAKKRAELKAKGIEF